ncbi:MAG TPA: hypothetical protein PK230_08550, partial [Chitinophagales bacterium]|nr:hypothetical protein [Chitinophagales bacterium]
MLIRWRYFLHRLVRFEYWDMKVFYFPVAIYLLYLAAKARSLTFFAAANPAMRMGGVGYSKYAILSAIDSQFVPPTLFFPVATSASTVLARLEQEQWQFPLIIKPDMGERGQGVERLINRQELEQYLQMFSGAFMLQKFLTLPIELGVFYHRFPINGKSTITSITRKHFLTLEGTGKHTVAQLLEKSPRYVLQLERFRQKQPDLLQKILPKGEQLRLEPIGNHCRGTIFLDARQHISPEMVAVFDQIVQPMQGFYYGRFDLKTESFEALQRGQLQIMEVNGVASEAAHIYQPGYSLR